MHTAKAGDLGKKDDLEWVWENFIGDVPTGSLRERTDFVHGFNWLTMVPPHLAGRVREDSLAGLFAVERLASGGVWLQATRDPRAYDVAAAESVRAALREVLPTPTPEPYALRPWLVSFQAPESTRGDSPLPPVWPGLTYLVHDVLDRPPPIRVRRPHVGSSEWVHRAPYAVSLQQTLQSVQQQVLDAGEFVWEDDLYADDEVDPDEDVAGEQRVLARPTTLAELAAAKRQGHRFWQTGTHTILDMHAVVDPTRPGTPPLGLEAGVVHPLSDTEVRQLLGHAPATTADLDAVATPEGRNRLDVLPGPSWTGRCLVAVGDGGPVEVLYWGYSGD